MRLIQRIGSEHNGERLDALLAARNEHGAFFNEVWLQMEFGYPRLETHRQVAEAFAISARKLREAGVRVSLQISNTIGHGKGIAYHDCTGLVYDGSPVKNLVGHDGVSAKYSFCWNDRFFRDYICESARVYIEKIRPAEIWIDDDFRPVNHAPVQFGCFCEHCMASFNARIGTSFTREALVEEILHGDIAVRLAWSEFVRAGLASFTEEICQMAVEICPDVAFGLQNSVPRKYVSTTHDYILDTMYRVTGKPPMYRAGGGAYLDHDPNKMIYKMLELSYQHSCLPPYVKVLCPEIESIPETAMGKTMYGTAYETALYFAGGATDMSYKMLCKLSEPLPFYEEGFALFAKQLPYWEKLAALSASTRGEGVCCAMGKGDYICSLSQDATMSALDRRVYSGASPLARDGIPLTYAEACSVHFLHLSAAREMTDDELAVMLSRNVVTDPLVIDEIQRRGIGLGFEVLRADEEMSTLLTETYTAHPLNGTDRTPLRISPFDAGSVLFSVLTKIPPSSEILGVYGAMQSCAPLGISPDAPNGYSSVVFWTEAGGRWAVFGYGLWVGIVPSRQRDRILNVIDYIGGGVGARLLSCHQAVVMPRVLEDGRTAGVSVLNCTVGPEEDIRLLIRNPKTEKFTFDSQYDGSFDLPYEKTDDGYVVTVPKLSPWSVGTVFVG